MFVFAKELFASGVLGKNKTSARDQDGRRQSNTLPYKKRVTYRERFFTWLTEGATSRSYGTGSQWCPELPSGFLKHRSHTLYKKNTPTPSTRGRLFFGTPKRLYISQTLENINAYSLCVVWSEITCFIARRTSSPLLIAGAFVVIVCFTAAAIKCRETAKR